MQKTSIWQETNISHVTWKENPIIQQFPCIRSSQKNTVLEPYYKGVGPIDGLHRIIYPQIKLAQKPMFSFKIAHQFRHLASGDESRVDK